MPHDRLNNSLRSPERVAAICEAFRRELGYEPDEKFDILKLVELDLYDRLPGYKFQVCYDSELKDFAEVQINPPRLRVRESIYNKAIAQDATARYWIAHEVGHLILHANFTKSTMQKSSLGYRKSIKNQNAMRGIEAQADVFARFLLLSVQNFRIHDERSEFFIEHLYGVPAKEIRAHKTLTRRPEFRTVK